jgi:hypothetical protein
MTLPINKDNHYAMEKLLSVPQPVLQPLADTALTSCLLLPQPHFWLLLLLLLRTL